MLDDDRRLGLGGDITDRAAPSAGLRAPRPKGVTEVVTLLGRAPAHTSGRDAAGRCQASGPADCRVLRHRRRPPFRVPAPRVPRRIRRSRMAASMKPAVFAWSIAAM